MTATFTEFSLRPSSQKALAALGINQPTPIQEAALRPLLGGRDVIGQARTGSGKTLAFALPLMERVDWTERTIQAIVLVPTRELAVQVGGVIAQLIGRSDSGVALLYGGKAFGPQVSAIRSARIVVGTPGRTLDHLRQETLSLRHVKYLVLDEADEMLDRGFAPDVERVLRSAPRGSQKALFSATIADWVHDISEKHLQAPLTISLDEDLTPDDRGVSELIYRIEKEDKQDVLETLLDRRGRGSVVVFGRTKHGVQKLGKRLTAKGFPVAVLQGNLSQNARDRAMAEFRAGRLPILVATNVAARGIDVSDVDLVINFELPESASLFTHRIGRTGRMGRQGEAITLLGADEALKWRKIERELGRKIPMAAWGEESEPMPAEREAALVAQPKTSAESETRRDPSPRRRRRGRTSVAAGSHPDSAPSHAPSASPAAPFRHRRRVRRNPA